MATYTVDLTESLGATDTGLPYYVDYGEFAAESVGGADGDAYSNVTGPAFYNQAKVERPLFTDLLSIRYIHPVHEPSTRTNRRVWTLPAVLAYGRWTRIENGLYASLGLTNDAANLTIVTVGNVVYAVEQGTGLPIST